MATGKMRWNMFDGLIEDALAEDGARSDVTTAALVPLGVPCEADVLVKQNGVICGLPLAGRVAVTALALAPLGLLMGTPFPQGLALARQCAPELLPWIWAVNGCASVVSAVLAPMVAIDLGFRVVMVIGAVAYLGALASLGRLGGTLKGNELVPAWPGEEDTG